MTEFGYKNIIEHIVDRQLTFIPANLTVEQLQMWLDGYATCQNDIIDIIDEFAKGPRE